MRTARRRLTPWIAGVGALTAAVAGGVWAAPYLTGGKQNNDTESAIVDSAPVPAPSVAAAPSSAAAAASSAAAAASSAAAAAVSSQPLVTVDARAHGTWYSIRELVLSAEDAAAGDTMPGTLWAVAAAMKRVMGTGCRLSHLAELLVQYHPAIDGPRRERCKEWWDARAREGWGNDTG